METVEYKNISFTVWDVGGQDKVTFSPTSSISNYILVQCNPYEWAVALYVYNDNAFVDFIVCNWLKLSLRIYVI